jgi:2-dehydro-3-deoxyphosphogluconate aldolase/(4S)-4-hydroxy-2-oxoglutarate aldolase
MSTVISLLLTADGWRVNHIDEYRVSMNNILEHIGFLGILPVAIVEDENKAVPLAQTLSENGLPVIEVTLRTQTAVHVVERIVKEFPDMLVGAGTVITVADAQSVIDAGARFIVSPGLSAKVVEYCIGKSIPVIPGVLTPTEIQQALEYGLEVVKFFPAEAIGGLSYLKAVAAPFKNLKFIPTGGIEQSTLLSYLQFPKVLACGGSWMVHPEMLKTGQFEKIASCTRQAVASVLGFELRHIGLYTRSTADAYKATAQLAKRIQYSVRETEDSLFSEKYVEELQHISSDDFIALGTNFIERGAVHLAQKGIVVKPETKQFQNGQLVAVDLDLDINGFTLRLIQV